MRLRLATTGDAAALAELYRPYVEHSSISFEASAPSAEEMAARLSETLPAYPWVVAEEEAQLLGYAYGHRFAARAAYGWSVETSVYVRDGAQRRGIGAALYGALLTLLEAQGYREAFAGVALPNPASVALHEAFGFERVATFRRVGWTFGRWHDVGWWQRPIAGAAPQAPAMAIPVDELAPEVLAAALQLVVERGRGVTGDT